VRFLVPPAPTKALSPPQWQGPSPLPQRCADPWPAGGPKPPAKRPPRPRRALPARRVGRWPSVRLDLPVCGEPSRTGGETQCVSCSRPDRGNSQNANRQRRCHGRGHRPCQITTLILGPPGAKAPGQRPPRPRRELFARRVGRWPAVGAGGTGPGGSVARRRGKRHAFPVSAQRGNPFPRIGKIFPAVRRSDCFFSALPTRSAQNAVMGSKARRPGATPKPALCGGLFPSWLRGDHAAAGTSPYTRQGPSPQG
jgi:hypothetical protein